MTNHSINITMNKVGGKIRVGPDMTITVKDADSAKAFLEVNDLGRIQELELSLGEVANNLPRGVGVRLGNVLNSEVSQYPVQIFVSAPGMNVVDERFGEFD